jgi:hypothetical protein
MRYKSLALFAAAALLGLGLAADAGAAVKAEQELIKDQLIESKALPTTGEVLDQKVREYLRVRDELKKQPGMEAALEPGQSGALTGKRDQLEAALKGSQLSADEFMQIHQAALQTRVTAGAAASPGVSGAAGAAASPGVSGAAGAAASPGTTGAAPATSPR